MSCAASSVTRSPPSSNRPISFIRPVRSSSLSRSTRPDPQMPCGRAVADHAERERAVVVERDVLDRAVQRRHAARDRAALERRPGRARRRQDPVPVAEDQLGVGADVHDRDEPIFVREVHRQHAGRRIGADVPADDRRAVHARLADGSAAGSAGRSAIRLVVVALALGHLDLGDRPVRVLPDRVHALPEEQVAHRRVADHDHLVDRRRIDREVLDRVASGSRPACASAACRGCSVS